MSGGSNFAFDLSFVFVVSDKLMAFTASSIVFLSDYLKDSSINCEYEKIKPKALQMQVSQIDHMELLEEKPKPSNDISIICN